MTRPLRPESEEATPVQPEASWEDMRAAVEAALALAPEARAAFLARAFPDNASLQKRAQELLDACEQAARPAAAFLATPATTFAAPLLQDWIPLAESEDAQEVRAALAQRYQIERELAHGGTATVYLAHDLRHGRHVAIKVLKPVLGAALSAERFLQEIRVTAGLVHPHILPLHDSGEAAGRLYYVMPFIDGETLRERMARSGALSIDVTLRIMCEVTEAIAYAHDRGIVHRDIKPANILLADGHALVADFGIARAVQRARELPTPNQTSAISDARDDDVFTVTGASLGTPAYMAPEQVHSPADIDARADLYALGIVLYEALAGVHPFRAHSRRAMLSAHLGEQPAPLDAHRPDVPPALASLVLALLAKDPADRPPNARTVLHALQSIAAAPDGGGGAQSAVGRSIRERGRTLLRTSAIAALLLSLVALAGYALLQKKASNAGTDAIRTLAVLPFEVTNGSANDEYFGDGMTDELAHALARLPTLRIAGRTSSYAFKGKQIPAPEIGRELGVEALLVGTIRRAGERLRLATQLIRTTDGTVMWDSVFESRTGDVFAVQDELTRSIVAAVAPALRGQVDAVVVAERGTADPGAYDLYLNGNYHFLLRGANNVQRAVSLFQQAIARDPSFARAHAGLALAYRVLPIYNALPPDSMISLVESSATRAVALDSTLGVARLALAEALVMNLRFREANDAYRAAVALDPASASAQLSYGFSLLNHGRHEEALHALHRALQLDPALKSAASALAFGYLVSRRFDEALDAAKIAMALDSVFPLAIFINGQAQVFGGQPDDAVHTQERGVQLYPRDTRLLLNLLLAYAATGRWDDAQRIRARLHATPDAELIYGTEAAWADLVFGDPEPLVRILTTEHGLQRYALAGGVLGCNPLLDPLWQDHRFKAQMQRLSIPPCPLARPWPLSSRGFVLHEIAAEDFL